MPTRSMDAGQKSSSRAVNRELLGRVLVIAIFVVTSVAWVWPALSIGGTYAATDLLQRTSPYREELPNQAEIGNALQTDQLSATPLLLEFYEALRHGEFQLWEPDIGGGVPLGTAVYNGLLAPWNVVLLVFSGPLGPTFASLLGAFVAQLGMYLFARRLGLGRWGAVLAAVAFVFSGPVTALHLRINQVLILPWVFYGLHGAMVERRGRYVVTLGLAVAAAWLAGFPMGALVVMYAAAAFALYLLWSISREADPGSRVRKGWRHAWPAGAAFVAGTCIAAIQLVPSYEFISVSGALERSYPIWHRAGLVKLATAVSGKFFGAFQDGDWWWPEKGYANPVEASSTVGMVALLMLVAVVAGKGIQRHRQARPIWQFLLPMGLIVLVAVYLGGPVLGLLHYLPFVSENSFGRSRFLLSFVLAIAAGYGLTALAESPRARRAPRIMRLEVVMVMGLIAIGVYEGLTVAASEGQLKFVMTRLVVPALAAALAVGAIWWFRRSSAGLGTIGVGVTLAVLLAAELLWGAWGFTPGSPPEAFYPSSPAFAAIDDDVGPGGQYRFLGLGLFGIVPPNEAALLDLSDARYFYPVLGSYETLWALADESLAKRPGDPWLVLFLDDELGTLSPALDRMSVRYLTVPIDEPLLGATQRDFVVSAPEPGMFAIPPGSQGVRGIALEVALGDGCREGWLEIDNGVVTSRRLVRDVRDLVVFPLPDVNTDTHTSVFALTATNCENVVLGDRGQLFLADEDGLLLVDVDGWVVYRRPNALPRVSIAERAVFLGTGEPADPLVEPSNAASVFVEQSGATDLSGKGTATIVSDLPGSVSVVTNVDSDALLVLRDVSAPGWTVTVDGEREDLITVDRAFMGVTVPAGTHEVEFAYRPTSFKVGVVIALLGLLLLGATAVMIRLRP